MDYVRFPVQRHVVSDTFKYFVCWVILHGFCLLSFSKPLFSKSFKKTIGVSNSLDPDQTRRFVGSDLGTNCLQRLSADDTSR